MKQSLQALQKSTVPLASSCCKRYKMELLLTNRDAPGAAVDVGGGPGVAGVPRQHACNHGEVAAPPDPPDERWKTCRSPGRHRSPAAGRDADWLYEYIPECVPSTSVRSITTC
eukprot:9486859-Pyramimonas_sp.AAC.2